jgi:hypothetical protein
MCGRSSGGNLSMDTVFDPAAHASASGGGGGAPLASTADRSPPCGASQGFKPYRAGPVHAGGKRPATSAPSAPPRKFRKS